MCKHGCAARVCYLSVVSSRQRGNHSAKAHIRQFTLTFLDKSGHAVCISSDCAGVTYQRDIDGTVVGEQYADADGNPARSLLGQYGELYQHNEQGAPENLICLANHCLVYINTPTPLSNEK